MSRRQQCDTHWLSELEREAWLGLVRITMRLPSVLDAELERDAGLSFFEYSVLAMLSEQETRTLRMNQLAAVTNASPTRLSNVAKRLEQQDLLRRRPDPDDGRYTQAVLTDAGLAAVVAAAPAHVATVRSHVLDALSATQLRQLVAATDRILASLDPQEQTRPGPITARPPEA